MLPTESLAGPSVGLGCPSRIAWLTATTPDDDRGAELLFGDRKDIEMLRDPDGTYRTCRGGEDHAEEGHKKPSRTRPMSEEEKTRLKEKYSMAYDR